MSLGPRRTAKLTLWTLAGLTWSWAAVAATAHPPADTAPTPPPEPATSTANGASAAMPEDAPGRVLVLRLRTPPEREVVTRRVYVDAPPSRTAPAARSAATTASAPPPSPPAPVPAPPPQRSSGS